MNMNFKKAAAIAQKRIETLSKRHYNMQMSGNYDSSHDDQEMIKLESVLLMLEILEEAEIK
jgi:hypothetical protein